MALDISVPVERLAPPKDLEVRPKQARAWIEALPLSQSAVAARTIATHLATFNRSKIDFDDRLQLTEIYRPVAHTLLDELDAIYGRSLLPLPPKAREALALARELATGLADAYKILLVEKSGKLLAFGAKKQIPQFAFGAMEHLVAHMRTSYRSYTPIAEGLWREIHALYLHAEREGFLLEPADAGRKMAVFDLYAETLLVSLTDPYRLLPGDVDRVTQTIRGYPRLVTLGQARPSTSPSGHFLVPCDTDKPPKPLLSANDDPGGPHWRLFDANPIVDRIRQLGQAVTAGQVSAATSKSVGPEMLVLFGKLVALWGDPPKRSARRDPMDTSVAICAGLRAITHFLSVDVYSEERKEAQKIAQGITIPLISVPDDEVSRGMNVNEWEVVNQSAGGLKVRRSGSLAQGVTVGEVIGIRSMGKAAWTIGVVRWLTSLDEGGMEFGIQFLAPAAHLVALQPTIASIGQVRAGLLLAEDDDFAAADMVLAPPSTYSDLREYEIEDNGLVSRVRATSLIERTGRFELFHIAPS